MSNLTLVLLAAVVVGCGVLIAVLVHLARIARQLEGPAADSGLIVLQNQVEALREQVQSTLDGGRLELDRRLEETNRVVGDVRRGLGEVDRQVRAVTAAARDLQGLQELLRSPKMRGGVGEHLLEELLGQVLPRAHYTMQYEFSGGERVDAVLHLGEGLVPVDAKFPLENFRKLRSAAQAHNDAEEKAALRLFRADVRRHVEAIAKKYLRPGEGTYEFAMMYIPSEAVYQETIQQEGEDGLDLFHFALTQRVVPVSPQSFYAYLQVIVFGLRGMSIEQRTREIMNRLGDIQNRLTRFNESFDLVYRHLGNAYRQADEAGRRLARLDAAVSDLSNDEAATRPRLQVRSSASHPDH